MSSLFACIGGTLGSWIAVVLGGALGIGILGLYVASVVGAAAGVFYGRRVAATLLG